MKTLLAEIIHLPVPTSGRLVRQLAEVSVDNESIFFVDSYNNRQQDDWPQADLPAMGQFGSRRKEKDCILLVSQDGQRFTSAIELNRLYSSIMVTNCDWGDGRQSSHLIAVDLIRHEVKAYANRLRRGLQGLYV